MTKNYLFLLLGLLLAACSSDDKDEQPILVTNVVMPASGTVFKPGEKVTIMAKGFQDNDEICSIFAGRFKTKCCMKDMLKGDGVL